MKYGKLFFVTGTVFNVRSSFGKSAVYFGKCGGHGYGNILEAPHSAAGRGIEGNFDLGDAVFHRCTPVGVKRAFKPCRQIEGIS